MFDTPASKRCTKCGETKPIGDFYRSKRARDGHYASCKTCHLATTRRYRQRLRERNTANPPDMRGTKRCPSCERTKPAVAFHRNRAATDGLHWVCKACNTSGRPTRRAEESKRFRGYAITREQADALLAYQHGRCGICGQPFTSETPSIDHDHETGAVRGLLCGRCNRALGAFWDSDALLELAISYLRCPPMRTMSDPG